MDTHSSWYAERLQSKQNKSWKRLLRAQAPYQWNLRRQQLGRTLDIGCGIGRNLVTLAPGSLGVDHNPDSVSRASNQGLRAVTDTEFFRSPPKAESFDGILLAHVIEHMTHDDAINLLRRYLPFLRPGGKVFMICPQERGYASDPTHVAWTTGDDLIKIARALELEPREARSFPLPRRLGRLFTYNEFNLLAFKPRAAEGASNQ